jgi:hypothetical protein
MKNIYLRIFITIGLFNSCQLFSMQQDQQEKEKGVLCKIISDIEKQKEKYPQTIKKAREIGDKILGNSKYEEALFQGVGVLFIKNGDEAKNVLLFFTGKNNFSEGCDCAVIRNSEIKCLSEMFYSINTIYEKEKYGLSLQYANYSYTYGQSSIILDYEKNKYKPKDNSETSESDIFFEIRRYFEFRRQLRNSQIKK